MCHSFCKDVQDKMFYINFLSFCKTERCSKANNSNNKKLTWLKIYKHSATKQIVTKNEEL